MILFLLHVVQWCPLALSIVALLVALHARLHKKTPVYVKGDGYAQCSNCRLTVARYFTKGGNLVCANCDPKGFASAK